MVLQARSQAMLAQATKKEGLFSSQAGEIVALQGRVDDLTAEAAHERGTGDEARARLAATLATLESTVENLEEERSVAAAAAAAAAAEATAAAAAAEDAKSEFESKAEKQRAEVGNLNERIAEEQTEVGNHNTRDQTSSCRAPPLPAPPPPRPQRAYRVSVSQCFSA